MNEKDAREMIDAVGQWLNDGAPGATSKIKFCGKTKERTAEGLAREFCHILLDDARADGLGGCPLCQG